MEQLDFTRKMKAQITNNFVLRLHFSDGKLGDNKSNGTSTKEGYELVATSPEEVDAKVEAAV